jgi:DNA polymerase III subunit gamma/tau
LEYQALYRKYRPQTFDDVIGQTHVTATLQREVADGHVAHAYLFAGPRGTGKTTTARILAKALNCENRAPDGSPDNICPACLAITQGSSLDVMELDAASHNSVEDIRDMRVSVSTVASSAAGRRVFILDEAHMLSKAAGNALLKTLEEPPEGVHFVLATTEPYKLLDTIRSRTQRFDFHAISIEGLAAHLSRISDAEGYKVNPGALVVVARHANGSVRDSLSLLEQVAALGDGTVDVAGVNRALGLADADAYGVLVDAVAGQDAKAALELVARLASQGADLRRFAAESVGFFRGVFLAHYAPNLAEVADESAEVLADWKKAAGVLGPGETLRAVDLLGEALIKLREGREERLMLELALIRLTRPETSEDPSALLARFERLERRLASGELDVRPEPRVTAPATEAKTAPSPPGPREVAVVAEPAPPAAVLPEPDDRPFESEPAGVAGADPAQSPTLPQAAVSFEQFTAIWPALFGSLRDLLGARRWALFRETAPGTVIGSTLVVDVRHDFHLRALQDDPAVSRIVSTRAGDLLGSEVRVDFRAAGSADGAATPAVDKAAEEFEIDLDKDRLLEVDDNAADPLRLVLDELGADLIDEFDAPED